MLRPTPFVTLDLNTKLRITIAQGALNDEAKHVLNPLFSQFAGDKYVLGEGHTAKAHIGVNNAGRLAAIKVVNLNLMKTREWHKRQISIINERATLKAMGQFLGSYDDKNKHVYSELQELHAVLTCLTT